MRERGDACIVAKVLFSGMEEFLLGGKTWGTREKESSLEKEKGEVKTCINVNMFICNYVCIYLWTLGFMY